VKIVVQIGATFSVLWLINFLLAAMAYRVNRGSQGLDMEAGAFWGRSALAGLLLAVYIVGAETVAVIVVALGHPGEESRDVLPLFLILMIPYVVVAPWCLHWAFGLDNDPIQAISLFLIHHFMPGFVVFLLAVFAAGVGSLGRLFP
jgi:hypothetical protein